MAQKKSEKANPIVLRLGRKKAKKLSKKQVETYSKIKGRISDGT